MTDTKLRGKPGLFALAYRMNTKAVQRALDEAACAVEGCENDMRAAAAVLYLWGMGLSYHEIVAEMRKKGGTFIRSLKQVRNIVETARRMCPDVTAPTGGPRFMHRKRGSERGSGEAHVQRGEVVLEACCPKVFR